MRDADCIAFLQWAMPRLGLNWSGFRHCHGQVCKRLGHRMRELGLPGFAAYRDFVLDHDTEWSIIDDCCRVTVSRFYRDKAVFDALAEKLLPQLAAAAVARKDTALRVWSAGCGAGEEPYSVALAWHLAVAPRFPGIRLEIAATDIDKEELMRADAACYRAGPLRELPAAWRDAAFVKVGPLLCLRPEYREGIGFQRQDIRAHAPQGPFDLILCRNLAFTYFDEDQRRTALGVMLRTLMPGGALVLGRREHLPAGVVGLSPWAPGLPIFIKNDGGERR